MQIILATRNKTKLLEGKAFFAGTGIDLMSMDEAGIEGAAEEYSNTLEGNALAKAVFVFARGGGRGVLADDTGLYVRALGGAPGVDAAVWGGKDKAWRDRTGYCLEQMAGVEDRFATFVTVVAVIGPDGRQRLVQGRVDGTMRDSLVCEPKTHMPYSALFVPQGHAKCWAEMSNEEENLISHRGKAFGRALAYLRAEYLRG